MSFFHCRLKTTSNELSLEPSELNEFPAYIVETLPLPRLNVTFYAQIVLKEVSMKPHGNSSKLMRSRSVFAPKEAEIHRGFAMA